MIHVIRAELRRIVARLARWFSRRRPLAVENAAAVRDRMAALRDP